MLISTLQVRLLSKIPLVLARIFQRNRMITTTKHVILK